MDLTDNLVFVLALPPDYWFVVRISVANPTSFSSLCIVGPYIIRFVNIELSKSWTSEVDLSFVL